MLIFAKVIMLQMLMLFSVNRRQEKASNEKDHYRTPNNVTKTCHLIS